MAVKTEYTSPISLYQRIHGEAVKRCSAPVVVVNKDASFQSKIYINETAGSSETVIAVDIQNVLNVQYNTQEQTVYFDLQHSGTLYNFALQFSTPRAMNEFVDTYVKCIYEFGSRKPITKDDTEELSRFKMYLSLDYPSVPQYQEEPVFQEPAQHSRAARGDNGKNTILRLAPNTGSTYIVRKYTDHSDLGIFNLDAQSTFRNSIQNVGVRGSSLSVVDALNTNRDKDVLLLDEQNKKFVFDLNMDRGQVIKTYEAKDSQGVSYNVNKLLPVATSGADASATFLGFNSRDHMMFDTRTPEPVVNKSEYKTDNKFTVGCTTTSGKLAMGSNDGIVRLYSAPCKTRATINFQTNVGKEPVTGIDVSPDEEWILATCPYYLSVFNIRMSNGKLGFDSPMGKEKPPLRRLTIKQGDQSKIARFHGGTLPEFSPAKFEIKNGRVVAIIAGCGSALVSWDFRYIENNSLPKYSIVYLTDGESIVDNAPLNSSYDVLYMTDDFVSVAQRNRRR